MKVNKIAEHIFSVVLIGIGMYVFLAGSQFRGNDKYFPMIIGAMMVGTAVWTLVEDLRTEKTCIDLKKINFLAVGVTIAALLAYVLLFQLIGYIFSTILLGVSVILGLRYSSLKGAILWPTGMVVIIFVVFKVLLKVPLPTLFL